MENQLFEEEGLVQSPKILQNFVAQTPIAEKWGKMFWWLFLGREDGGSDFFGLPKEVVYHVVSVI